MNENISPMEFVVTKMEVEVDDEIPEDGINLSIINELKCRRHLWDSRHKLYKDSEIKKKSWTEVARKLGIREPFLKTRWRSLRDRYMKERRRDIQVSKTGEPRKTRPWLMMHKLDFLNKAVQPSAVLLHTHAQKKPTWSRNNTAHARKKTSDGLFGTANVDQDGIKMEEKDDCEIPSLDVVENFEVESQSTAPNSSVTNVPPTYLIINPDNTIQCLPSVQLQPPKSRPLRRLEPAISEPSRNLTFTVSPTASVAGTSTMTAQVQHVQSMKPVSRLSPAPVSATRPPESQAQESESSEHYFYLSIAKEMESRSTRVRLKMRKIISDALFNLYEEEAQEGSTTQ